MGRRMVGYQVGAFHIYREFWTAAEAIERFVAEVGGQIFYAEDVLTIRRENPGLWLVEIQSPPGQVYGEIALAQQQNGIFVSVVSSGQFDRSWNVMRWLAEQVVENIEAQGLTYPPRPTDRPQLPVSGPSTLIVQGDYVEGDKHTTNNAGGDIVGRDKTVSDTDDNGEPSL